MSQLSVQIIDKSPLNLNFIEATSAASGDLVSNFYFDDILLVKNDSGSDTLVNISGLVTCDQGDYKDVSTVISTGTIGFFPLHSRLTNWTTKQVVIHCNPTSGVNLAVYRQLR
jgi:hypothetical protein